MTKVWKGVVCLCFEKGTVLEPPYVDGSLVTLSEPRPFTLTEIRSLKSKGFEEIIFHGRLILISRRDLCLEEQLLKCTGSVADGNKCESNFFA